MKIFHIWAAQKTLILSNCLTNPHGCTLEQLWAKEYCIILWGAHNYWDVGFESTSYTPRDGWDALFCHEIHVYVVLDFHKTIWYWSLVSKTFLSAAAVCGRSACKEWTAPTPLRDALPLLANSDVSTPRAKATPRTYLNHTFQSFYFKRSV